MMCGEGGRVRGEGTYGADDVLSLCMVTHGHVPTLDACVCAGVVRGVVVVVVCG